VSEPEEGGGVGGVEKERMRRSPSRGQPMVITHCQDRGTRQLLLGIKTYSESRWKGKWGGEK